LALKEGLIKFQAYIEGETLLVVTNHAALTWSKTFQNVNQRLLTWGTVFAAYPNLRIVHRAGRVHSNVDPISRLCRRVPYQQGPTVDATQHISLNLMEDPIRDMYSELGEKFEEKLLSVVLDFVASEILEEQDYSFISQNSLEICLPSGHKFTLDHISSNSYSILVGMQSKELDIWKMAYSSDTMFSKILKASITNNDEEGNYSQYQIHDGLIYFEDWNGNFRLCVFDSLRVSVMAEIHNSLTESAHGGHADMCTMPIRSESNQIKHHKTKRSKSAKVQVNLSC